MGRSLSITLLAALLVIGGYEAFLRIAKPRADVGQDQYATNRIRLENYVDDDAAAPGVVVGSSLTARIPAGAWPRGWQVLSQAGSNALVGLEAIERKAVLPQKILIEINTLDSAYNKDDVEAVLGISRAGRHILWFTRTANRPANLLVWYMRPRDGSSSERAGAGFSTQLAQWRQNYRGAPASHLFENLQRAKLIVERLRAANVEVVFFEMPVDASLVGLRRARHIRQATAAIFPPSSYCWHIAQDARSWRTIDGIHLLPQDARLAAASVSGRCAAADRMP